MNATELKTIAASLAGAGAPGLPTVVLTREVPLFEVEFAALEFAEEAKLPSSDWAALALARGLGELSPADIDAYLGLGEAVSEALMRRLLDEGLIEECTVENAETAKPAQDSGIGAFFRRVFGASKMPPIEAPAPPSRAQTAARKLRESRAATGPMCQLSSAGAQALERGAVVQRRVRPARLLFLAEPLLFVGVVDEKRQRYTQHRRPNPLEPERVPRVFQVLDATFGLSQSERIGACGIDASIRGFPGHFVGVVPGAQWEVRQVERRTSKGREQQMAVLVLAAFPSSEEGGLTWHAYLRQHDQTQDCPHIDATRFLQEDRRSLTSLLNVIEGGGPLPVHAGLRSDGAFDLRCDGTLLPGLLGEADRPSDAFVPAIAPRKGVFVVPAPAADSTPTADIRQSLVEWHVGLRVHAAPTDELAARATFYDFLRRRDADLRRDFDGTCAEVATDLSSYWGDNPGLPSADDAAMNLWPRAELRAALCMRRRHRDLVAPYERMELAQ